MKQILALAAVAVCLPNVLVGARAEERLLDVIIARRADPRSPGDLLPRWTAPGRPTLALALSGGGARGVAHVGVLEAMQEDGVEFDAIAGTSFGALFGAFVCGGYGPREVERILQEQDWNEILAGTDTRHRILSRTEDIRQASALVQMRFRGHRRFQIGALVDSRPFERELYRFLLRAQLESGGDFDRLRCRFRPVGTDVLTGRAVVPASGDLVAAVRGSSAVPGVFRPVPFGDALLVDGGLVENIPVDTARTLGTDLVVAVDVTEGLIGDPNVRGAFDLLNRSVNVLIEAQSERLRGRADLVLEPAVEDLPVSDFREHVEELARSGRDAYRSGRAEMWQLLEARATDRAPVSYDRLEVKGTAWIDPETLARRLGGPTGTVTRYRVAAEVARALNLGPLRDGRAEWIEAPSGERVLRFDFIEGLPVREVSLEGPGVPELSREELPLGQPLCASTMRAAAADVRQRLVREGRVLLAFRSLESDPETGSVRVEVADVPVGNVTITASGNVRGNRLERYFSDLQGQDFRFDRLADRLDELVVRGVIFDWSLSPRMREDGTVDVEVAVRGDQHYKLAGALEYRDALSWAGQLRIAKANLTGRGDLLELSIGGAQETRQAEMRYRTEYGVGYENLGGELALRYFDSAYPFVDEDQSLVEALEEDYRGWRVSLGVFSRLRWGAVLKVGFFHERDDLEASASGPEEDRSRTSLFFRADVDRHDHLLFPTSGTAMTLRGQQALSGQDLWKYELLADGSVSPGKRRRHTLTVRGAAGLSGGADRRPFFFNPGGHRRVYGVIPYGAAAPHYARAGVSWRMRWVEWKTVQFYLEAGLDAIRTAQRRTELDEANTLYGLGGSLVAHTEFLGPVTFGVARNDAGATTAFLTLGYGLFEGR